MEEQVTEMAIKVDLQCHCCYEKIKKILCDIPPIKDQIFDMKQNTVKIKVVCCSPEKVPQKICCKGGEIILGIETIPPKQSSEKQPTPPKLQPPPPEKKPSPPPPVLGYPLGYAVGQVYVCPPCHYRGCGWFCPRNCQWGRPPKCDDGCGRPAPQCRSRGPPMGHDGCGRLAPECRCQRPSYSRCCD